MVGDGEVTLKILLFGCSGSMGKVVNEIAKKDNNFSVVAGVDNSLKKAEFPIYKDIIDVKEDIDVVIDFSSTLSLPGIIEYGKKNKIPLVLATTGYNDDELEMIEEDYDIEIIEKHHNKKIDSPSGTANMLKDIISSKLENKQEYVYGRVGNNTKRKKNEIGIHAVRGGTISGEHIVLFAGEEEVLEIKHTAHSKRLFAKGALKASSYIVIKEKGIYNMDNLINEIGGNNE